MNEVSNISDNSKMAAACGYTLLPDVAVSALFVRKDSIYKELGVDCWDAERNALNWPGGNPLIAHPPCRAWGQLSHWAKPLPGEKEGSQCQWISIGGGTGQKRAPCCIYVEQDAPMCQLCHCDLNQLLTWCLHQEGKNICLR
jgi:hypothetical protein